MTGRIRIASLAMAALMTAGLAGPAIADTSSTPAPATSPSSEPAPSASADASAPAPPVISSTTATTDSIQVAWEWPDPGTAPDGVTSVIVRAAPGDHEVTVGVAETTALIEALDPDTEYAITVLAAADDQIGEPSEPTLMTTMAVIDTGSDIVDEATMKPMASPGDVDSLIITTGDDTTAVEQATTVAADLPVSGVSVEEVAPVGSSSAVMNLSEGISNADVALVIDEIKRDPRVVAVEPNGRMYRATFPDTVPNDSLWSSTDLWGLHGTYGIQIATDTSTMGVPWTSGQGEDVVVAVLDTGYTSHPDLNDNYVDGYDFVSSDTPTSRSGATNSDGDYIDVAAFGAVGRDDNPADPGDWNDSLSSSWHGTHVAGTIAALANNATGVIGVAPRAKIQPVRVLSFDGGSFADIADAITWASGGAVSGVPSNATPAAVINMSLGTSIPTACPTVMQDEITAAINRGTVVVVSAGNSSLDAGSYAPANCVGVITVASTDSNGNKSWFSNDGATVEIAAPGSGILSTYNSGTTTPDAASYKPLSGTSMAAPHVSGVAALIKLTYPNLTPSQVLSRIQTAATSFPGGSTCTACGAGIVNANAAVTTEPIPISISPADGASAGGEAVSVSGYNLSGTPSMTFGGTSALSVSSPSAYSMSATTPPSMAAGTVTVTVGNGVTTRSLASAFTFHDPPTITGVSPSSGSTAGGTSVSLAGTNLSATSAVSFGGTSATITSTTSGSVTVSTPAGTAGTVSVTVTTPGGTTTRVGSFTYVAPPAPPPATPPISRAPDSSTTATGGGLNEITTIAPAASGPPGSVIALAGWGLSTTRGVYFNDYPAASWKVVSDSHVEVVVPDIPPGVYVIHDVLAPEVGRASFWEGFHVLPRSSTAPVVGTPPAQGTTPGTSPGTPATSSAADLVGFRPNSSALSASTKTKLTRMTGKLGSGEAAGTVLVFSDKRGTAKSKKVARARAKNVISFLQSQGVAGEIRTIMEKGSTRTLRKSAVVRLSTDPGASTVTTGERVNSLIVRYGKGVSPTEDGAVRGSANVTGGLSTGMTLGPNLGLRMYRVDFASPVTLVQADKAAAQMMKDRGVQFAEPDRIVRATITAN